MSLICGLIYQNKFDYLNKMLTMCSGNVRETSGLLHPLCMSVEAAESPKPADVDRTCWLSAPAGHFEETTVSGELLVDSNVFSLANRPGDPSRCVSSTSVLHIPVLRLRR